MGKRWGISRGLLPPLGITQFGINIYMTQTKQFKPGDSIIYITSFLLRPHDDIEQFNKAALSAAALIAHSGGEGVEFGYIESTKEGGAMCRFFRRDNGHWTLRNTANAEYAVNANIRHFEHAATGLIETAMKLAEMNRKKFEAMQ